MQVRIIRLKKPQYSSCDFNEVAKDVFKFN